MKFYEAVYPYYALIKAESEQEAEGIYAENITDVDIEGTDINEVGSLYARVAFNKRMRSGELTERQSNWQDDFYRDKSELLLVDGNLF